MPHATTRMNLRDLLRRDVASHERMKATRGVPVKYLEESDGTDRKLEGGCQGPGEEGSAFNGGRVSVLQMKDFWSAAGQQCECP